MYYRKIAAVMGGVTAAIFGLKVWEWQENTGLSEGWVRVSAEEMMAQTGLTVAEQALAREQLRAKGLLVECPESDSDSVWPMRFQVERWEEYLHGKVPPGLPAASGDRYFPVKRQPIAITVTPHYQFQGPWASGDQLEQFQRQLLEYAKEKGMENPAGWVFKIVDGLTKGIVSPFWDEFISDRPLGSTQQVKRDWEIEPGIPYPAFEEERIQYYIQKGEPLEMAVAKARGELRKPTVAKDLWAGFLRKCDRLADDALKAKQQGVTTPYLPPSFSQRREITKEEVMAKLSQVSSPPPLPHSEAKPSLEQLQKAYQSTLGRSWVKQQLQLHPEWGYEIIDNEVQESLPF